MKCQISIFDIAVISIVLVIFSVFSIYLLEKTHIFTKTVVINVVYDTNEAYRLLVSLLSLNYTYLSVYEMLSYGFFDECYGEAVCMKENICHGLDGKCGFGCSEGCCCYSNTGSASKNFLTFLNSSLYYYFEKPPKCYKLIAGSRIIIKFVDKPYSDECKDTRFNAIIPIFVPYNDATLVEKLYLNYER